MLYDTSYKKLLNQSLGLAYNKKLVIGKSRFGKNIYALHFGNFDCKCVLCSCSCHAREYISTAVLNHLLSAPFKFDFGLWYVPICNPDGVKICLEGLSSSQRRTFLSCFDDIELKLWKANGIGVDINVNFDSNWGMGFHNTKTPSGANYIGKRPESEPETRALVNFAQTIMPDLNICFHTKGNVVYYGHKICKQKQKAAARFCKQLAHNLNYKAVKSKKSFGGFADFSSEKLSIISATVEIGDDSLAHPIKTSCLPQIASNFVDMFNFLNNYLSSR